MDIINVTALAVIIGIVNGIALLDIPQISSFVKFLIALAIGMIFGVFGVFGLTIETGLIVGLASSGLYKLTQNLGNK